LGSAIDPSIVGFIVATQGIRSVFFLFGAIASVGGVVTMIGGTETRGRLLEELSP